MAPRKRLPQSALGDVLRERFAHNLRHFRKRAGLTQVDLASAAGLGRVFINQVERGHTSITLESIGAIATALCVRPAALISSSPVDFRADPLEPDAGSARRTAGKRD